MKLSDFHFDLPDELIARYPAAERTGSRLLVLDGNTGATEHRQFTDLLSYLRPNDLLVFNNTRVVPARLFGQKATGGRVEILIERLIGPRQVLAHVRANKALKPDTAITLASSEEAAPENCHVRVLAKNEALYQLEFVDIDALDAMKQWGHMPLPPYIDRADVDTDRERLRAARRCGGRADRRVAFQRRIFTALSRLRCRVRFCHAACRSGYLSAGSRR
jgi:S-adenosylmethionine:tRNA ribosyltransferase-isomerase